MLKFLSTVYGKDRSPEFVMASKKLHIALTRQSRAWLAK
jgi:hypothetical protein